MPLPLAPVAVLAPRVGIAATAVWGLHHALVRATRAGWTDQRAEDALDGMDGGLAAHMPADRAGQRNAALRLRRVIRWRGGAVEVDLAAAGRLRLRRLDRTAQGGQP
jgi:hypothetical protein